MPRYVITMQRNISIIRVYKDNEFKKYKQISHNSPRYVQAMSLAMRREKYVEQLRKAKLHLLEYYRIDYEVIRGQYYITSNENNKLDAKYWSESIKKANPVKTDSEIVSDGVNYRSRYERSFSDVLKSMDLIFYYEPQVFINSHRDRFSDFGLFFPMFNRCVFIELLGRMKDTSYVYDSVQKLGEYMNSGIYIGRDLFLLSGDGVYIPGQIQMRSFIIEIITSLCERHIKRVHPEKCTPVVSAM